MIFDKNKISYGWILLWVVSHIVLGYACLYLGYFIMMLVGFFTFPLLQTLLLLLRFRRDSTGYWLLIYLPIFLSAGLIDVVNPILLIVIGIFFLEFILFLISDNFGRFTFTIIGLMGLGIVYWYSQSYFNFSLDFKAGYFFFLLFSSFFIGFGIEAHKWNITRMNYKEGLERK